jgi:hypothetical protein
LTAIRPDHLFGSACFGTTLFSKTVLDANLKKCF